MQTVVIVIHLMVVLALVGVVLLQRSEGGGLGIGGGSGFMTARGAANALTRTTAILAAVFFASSLGLTWFAATRGAPSGVMQEGVMEKMAPKPTSDVPAAPGAPAGAAPASVADPVKALPSSAPEGAKSGDVPK